MIAIILILAGFGFVNVIENQRRLHLREMDDTARQIFIAAQNHLTVAEASGQWDYEKLYKKAIEEDDNKEDEYNFFGGRNSGAHSIYTWLKTESNRYYYVTKNDLNYDTAIKYILPFGAIDETVRNGAGQYIILYDAKAATINGVFYTADGSFSFNDATTVYSKYIKDKEENSDARRTRSKQKPVIGWYGPGKAEDVDDSGLYRPIVTIENAENLVLNIVDHNEKNNVTGSSDKIKIVIKGLQSTSTFETLILQAGKTANVEDEANPKFKKLDKPINDSIWSAKLGTYKGEDYSAWNYRVYLDSVTMKNRHFADIFGSAGFIPGEDIEITVSIVKESGGVSKESKSAVVKTNSLFGSLTSSASNNSATIVNGRHLQNLSYDISHVGYKNNKTDSADPDLSIPNASINYSITWNDTRTLAVNEDPVDFIRRVDKSGYCTKTDDKVCVYNYGSDEVNQGKEQFSSIRNKNLTSISGNMNDLINFDIIEDPSSSGAGLVAKTESSTFSIENLKLINPKIEGASTNTGAFVGTADNSLTLTSCAAYNAAYKDEKWEDFDNSSQTLCISSSSGSVGGLVGNMKAGTITNSVASLYVKASGTTSGDAGDAGGLVGTCTGSVNITDSYVGGHTAGSATSDIDLIGYYQGVTTGTERGRYNIISAGGAAGGLIGSYADGKITNCYSTCSANGKTAAGGFIGNAAGGKIENAYCTGRIGGDGTKGAFIGSSTSTISISTDANKQSYYFQIINNDMPALGSSAKNITTVKAIDENLNSYNLFTDFTESENANAYDAGLARIYGENHYTLKTINSTGNDTSHALSGKAAENAPEWLTTHYGDWPAPETLVVNVPADS